MKDRVFSGKDLVSIIFFLKDFKAARNAWNIHEIEAMLLFKPYMTGPIDAVTKAQVTLPTGAAKLQESSPMSFFAIVNYHLERFATNHNIATVDADTCSFKEGRLTATDVAQ